MRWTRWMRLVMKSHYWTITATIAFESWPMAAPTPHNIKMYRAIVRAMVKIKSTMPMITCARAKATIPPMKSNDTKVIDTNAMDAWIGRATRPMQQSALFQFQPWMCRHARKRSICRHVRRQWNQPNQHHLIPVPAFEWINHHYHRWKSLSSSFHSCCCWVS